MLYYHLGSLIKIVVGALILLLVYFYVNVYDDPLVAISFSFLGIFIVSRGLSFYAFFGLTRLFSSRAKTHVASYSYKMSLLFGIFMLLNVLLLLMGQRNRLWGGLLIVGFVVLQIILAPASNKVLDDRY